MLNSWQIGSYNPEPTSTRLSSQGISWMSPRDLTHICGCQRSPSDKPCVRRIHRILWIENIDTIHYAGNEDNILSKKNVSMITCSVNLVFTAKTTHFQINTNITHTHTHTYAYHIHTYTVLNHKFIRIYRSCQPPAAPQWQIQTQLIDTAARQRGTTENDWTNHHWRWCSSHDSITARVCANQEDLTVHWLSSDKSPST